MSRSRSQRCAWLFAGCASLPGLAAAAGETDTHHDELQELVITGAPLRGSPLRSTQPVTVLSGEDLQRKAGTSLGETVSGQLGVSSTYFGPIASRPVIRGLSGYRVQMLNDGLASMDASSLSDDHAVTLETGLAEQIEVLRGPAALLYGSGGAGGAVNVVARRLPSALPPEPMSGFVELRGDSALGEGTAIGSFDAGSAGLLLHLEGFRRETGDVHIPGAAVSAPLREGLEAAGEPVPDSHGRVANSASESEGAGAGLSWFTERGAVGLAFDRFDSEYGLPSEEEASIDMQQNRVDLKGEYRPDGEGAWQALRLRAGYTDYAHTELEGPGEPGTQFFNEMYEVRASADHRLRQDWRGALGVQVAKQDFEALGEEAFVPPSVTRTLGAFVFEEWTSGDWTLQGGARFDNQRVRGDAGLEDYDANALNLSAGALWQVHPQQVLAFNVTRTQRHPQATELYANGVHAALARVETGNADLGRETGYTLDAAVRSSGGRVTWNVGAFANRYDGFIYAAPTAEIVSDALPVVTYRQQDADFHGLEAEIGAPVRLGIGTLTVRMLGDAQRGRLRDGGGNLPAIPPYRVGLALDLDRESTHLGFEATWHGSQDDLAPGELPTAGYTLLSLEASRHWSIGDYTSLFGFVRATNLLDEEARQHASPLKDLVPLPGRGVRAGLRMEFR